MQWLVSAERLAPSSLRPPHAMGNIYIGTELGTGAASLHCRILPSWDTIKTFHLWRIWSWVTMTSFLMNHQRIIECVILSSFSDKSFKVSKMMNLLWPVTGPRSQSWGWLRNVIVARLRSFVFRFLWLRWELASRSTVTNDVTNSCHPSEPESSLILW